jgi:hypothetical protein
MAGVGKRGGERLLHEADLHGELFKAPQGALGLVEVVDFLLDGRLYRAVDGGNREIFHLRLDFDGDARDHEDDLVGLPGNILIHPAFQIGKLALDGVLADTATSSSMSAFDW